MEVGSGTRTTLGWSRSIWIASGVAWLALAIACSGDDETVAPNVPTAAPTVVDGSPTGTAAAPTATLPAEPSRNELAVQAVAPIPPGLTVYYRTGKMESTLFMPGLFEIRADDDQPADIFESLPPVHDFALDFTSGVGFAATCIDTCTAFDPGEATLWESRDQGKNWREIGQLPADAYLRGVAGDQVVVMAYRGGRTEPPDFRLYPSGSVLAPPSQAEPGAVAFGLRDLGVLWREPDGLWLDDEGEVAWQEPESPYTEASRPVGRTSDGSLVAFDAGVESALLYMGQNGEPIRRYVAPSVEFAVELMLDDSTFLGTVRIHEPQERVAIALIDLAAGTITPIEALPGDPHSFQGPFDGMYEADRD